MSSNEHVFSYISGTLQFTSCYGPVYVSKNQQIELIIQTNVKEFDAYAAHIYQLPIGRGKYHQIPFHLNPKAQRVGKVIYCSKREFSTNGVCWKSIEFYPNKFSESDYTWYQLWFGIYRKLGDGKSELLCDNVTEPFLYFPGKIPEQIQKTMIKICPQNPQLHLESRFFTNFVEQQKEMMRQMNDMQSQFQMYQDNISQEFKQLKLNQEYQKSQIIHEIEAQVHQVLLKKQAIEKESEVDESLIHCTAASVDRVSIDDIANNRVEMIPEIKILDTNYDRVQKFNNPEIMMKFDSLLREEYLNGSSNPTSLFHYFVQNFDSKEGLNNSESYSADQRPPEVKMRILQLGDWKVIEAENDFIHLQPKGQYRLQVENNLSVTMYYSLLYWDYQHNIRPIGPKITELPAGKMKKFNLMVYQNGIIERYKLFFTTTKPPCLSQYWHCITKNILVEKSSSRR